MVVVTLHFTKYIFGLSVVLLLVQASGRRGSELWCMQCSCWGLGCSARQWISVQAAQQFLKFCVWCKENEACFWHSEAEEVILNQAEHQVGFGFGLLALNFFTILLTTAFSNMRACVSFATIFSMVETQICCPDASHKWINSATAKTLFGQLVWVCASLVASCASSVVWQFFGVAMQDCNKMEIHLIHLYSWADSKHL